jgi:uncharacterized delta-60 repeat protein
MTVFQKYFRGALLLMFLGLPGCGGNGEAQPGLLGNPSAGPTGAGFNQARGFNGPVRSIILVPGSEGDIYVSGDFTTYSNSTVAPIVRLRADGSINRSFTLSASINNRISSMALADDGSGDLYVADSLVEQDGAPPSGRGHIWKVHSDGTLDPTFTVGTITVVADELPMDPIFWAVVRSIVPVGDGSGRIYVAVEGVYNGISVGPVVRLNSNGSLDITFASQTSFAHVFRVVPANDGSGKIYIATFRRNDPSTWVSYLLLRLNIDGTLDPGFDTGARGSPESRISLMVPVGDGSGDLFAVGVFPNFSAPSPIDFRGLVRFHSNGTIDLTSPRPQVDPLHQVKALVKTADGNRNWFVAESMGENESKVLRYKADGSLNPVFRAALHGTPHVIVPAQDGTGDLYVGGQFLSFNDRGVSHLARVNSDGTLDEGTVVGAGFEHSSLPIHVAAARDGSGLVYVAGLLSSFNGAVVSRLARLQGNGRLDPIWSNGLFEGLGLTPHLLPTKGGSLYVGTGLVRLGVEPSRQLIQLLPDGREDPNFSIGVGFTPIGTIAGLALAEDGSRDLYVAGTFDLYRGVPAAGLVRIHSDGSMNRQFAPALPRGIVSYLAATSDGSGAVYVIADSGNGLHQPFKLQRNGNIDRGFDVPEPYRSHATKIIPLRNGRGDLLLVSTAPRDAFSFESRVVRLNSNGILDSGFLPVTLDGFVNDVALSKGTDDGMYAGGSFTRVNGMVSPGIVRIDRHGNRDPSFVVGQGFDGVVWSIDFARDESDDIFVGGTFTRYRSTTMQGIARLNRDGSSD